MNRELVERLIKKSAKLEDTTISSEYFTYHYNDMEALVEQVVRECISVVEKEFWSDPHEVYYQALELIKARFGVE